MVKSRMKVALAALVATVGVGLAQAPAANASIMGEGACSGLQLHSTWLDWGTGMVSVNVRNHTGDNPSVRNRTIRFQVQYTGPKAPHYHGNPVSHAITLQPSEQQSFAVFNWREVTGKDNQHFQNQELMNQQQYRFVHCSAH